MSYHPINLFPPTKARLGVSKMVLKVLVAQGALELQHLKDLILPLYKGN